MTELPDDLPPTSKLVVPGSVTLEGLRLALEEMRRLYEQRFESADKLDEKAATLLGSASIILSLVSTLQLTLTGTDQPFFYWILLVVALLLYIGLIVLTVWAISPTTYQSPIKADWDVLDKRLFQQDEKQALLTLIKAYKDQVIANKEVNDRKAVKVKLAGVSLAAMVIVLTFLSLISAAS